MFSAGLGLNSNKNKLLSDGFYSGLFFQLLNKRNIVVTFLIKNKRGVLTFPACKKF